MLVATDWSRKTLVSEQSACWFNWLWELELVSEVLDGGNIPAATVKPRYPASRCCCWKGLVSEQHVRICSIVGTWSVIRRIPCHKLNSEQGFVQLWERLKDLSSLSTTRHPSQVLASAKVSICGRVLQCALSNQICVNNTQSVKYLQLQQKIAILHVHTVHTAHTVHMCISTEDCNITCSHV